MQCYAYTIPVVLLACTLLSSTYGSANKSTSEQATSRFSHFQSFLEIDKLLCFQMIFIKKTKVT